MPKGPPIETIATDHQPIISRFTIMFGMRRGFLCVFDLSAIFNFCTKNLQKDDFNAPLTIFTLWGKCITGGLGDKYRL